LTGGRRVHFERDIDPEAMRLSAGQLSMLIEGIDWMAPERRWRPGEASGRG
jgi:transposase